MGRQSLKWINISLLIIWLCLLTIGIFWAWQAFDNMEALSSGGYLYGDNGEVLGLWDGWDKANYPHWMFSIALPIILLTGMPYWWIVAYFGIGFYLGYLLWYCL